jgi:hypothetical protein
MPRLVLPFACLALAGAAAWLLFETRDLAARLGAAEVAARQAATAAAAAQAAAAQHGTALASAAAEIVRLQSGLQQAMAREGAMADAVHAAEQAAARQAAAARAANREQLAAMPGAVRGCLQALHSCLWTEGFTGLRLLRATALDADGLHGVEAVHTAPDGLVAEILCAARMTAHLDRGAGRLSLRFFDGTRTADGERQALPEDGWEVVLAPVAGPEVEARLPQLVRAEGTYPEPAAPGPRRRPTDVDEATRLAWLERLDALLAAGGSDDLLRIEELRGIEHGAFLGARLLATDAAGHVRYGARCERLAVEVDRTAAVVALLLQDGTLNRGLATSTITAAGTRILLPDLTPDKAIATMLGMVVYK